MELKAALFGGLIISFYYFSTSTAQRCPKSMPRCPKSMPTLAVQGIA
jgi:hypothetical protein